MLRTSRSRGLGNATGCAFVREALAATIAGTERLPLDLAIARARQAQQDGAAATMGMTAAMTTANAAGTNESTSTGPRAGDVYGAKHKTTGEIVEAPEVDLSPAGASASNGGVNAEIPGEIPSASAAHGGVGVAVAGIMLGGLLLWTVFRR